MRTYLLRTNWLAVMAFCASVFVASAFSASSLCAQIKPSRTWLVDMARRPSAVGTIPSMMGGAEIYRGWGSFEHEQAWQLRLHAVAEPYRFSVYKNSEPSDTDTVSRATSIAWTTSLEFHHELTSNPMSDIGFNPRTARWEEQLLVHAAGSWWSARAGWLHRCKHDIDNTDPPNDQTSASYSPIRRTLILSGPTIAALTAPIDTRNWSFRFASGAEWYIVHEDYRTPPSSVPGSWKGLRGVIWVHGAASLAVSEFFSLSTQYYLSLPWFASRYGATGNTSIPFEARAELSATISSFTAAMDAVLSVEHTFDEVAFLSSMPSTHVQLGLRFRSR